MKLDEKIGVWGLVFVSVAIAVADLTGALENISWLKGRTSSLSLLVLALIATYLAVASSNREREFRELQALTQSQTKLLLASLGGVNIRLLKNTEEGLDYLCQRYSEANNSIDHAGLAPSLIFDEALFRKYDQAFTRVIRSPKVFFRYLANLDSHRWKLIRSSFSNANGRKYFVRYYADDAQITRVLSFSIIDETELIVRYPYDPSEPGYWLAVQHPMIIGLFSAYYRSLWSNAVIINKDNKEQFDELDKSYSS